MVKVIVLCLFCVVAMFFKQAQAELLEDKTNGYQIEYPSGWTAMPYSHSADLVKANINKDSSCGIQVRIYPSNGRNFSSFVDWYISDFISQMSRAGSKIEQEQRNSIDIGTSMGITVSLSQEKNNGNKWFLKEYFIPRGSNVYVLVAGSLYQNKEMNESLLDSIAQSLRFID